MQLQLFATTLISLVQTLTIRESHFKSNQSSNPLGFLFFIFLCIGGIVYLVYRCRRRSIHLPPPLPPFPQQPIYHPNMYSLPHSAILCSPTSTLTSKTAPHTQASPLPTRAVHTSILFPLLSRTT